MDESHIGTNKRHRTANKGRWNTDDPHLTGCNKGCICHSASCQEGAQKICINEAPSSSWWFCVKTLYITFTTFIKIFQLMSLKGMSQVGKDLSIIFKLCLYLNFAYIYFLQNSESWPPLCGSYNWCTHQHHRGNVGACQKAEGREGGGRCTSGVYLEKALWRSRRPGPEH